MAQLPLGVQGLFTITLSKTPLGEKSTRRRDACPYNTQHSQQTSMLPVKFDHTVSAGERSPTHALDRAATGTGNYVSR